MKAGRGSIGYCFMNSDTHSWIGSKGYDKNFGARPLARVVQEYVKKPLAEELLFGKLTGGGLVSIEFQDGELSFDYENTKATDRSNKKTRKKKAKEKKRTEPHTCSFGSPACLMYFGNISHIF